MSNTLVLSSRIRIIPYELRVHENGARVFTVYNHTFLATAYRSVEEDYAHPREQVQLWGVACEQQVEVGGSDASRFLVQETQNTTLTATCCDYKWRPLS